MKTSIKIKKFWYSDIAADGGVGSEWHEIQIGVREATAQFNGSDADTTNYKNIVGATLESQTQKGDMTVNFQLADLTPEVVAEFFGGAVEDVADYLKLSAPQNLNQAIEKSLRFLTSKNVLFEIPRASFDSYPMVNDDDLHYFQVNSVLLQPEKSGEPMFSYYILKDAAVSKNDITAFSLPEQTGPATIDDVAHTVSIEVASGTAVTALIPAITVSLGASIAPESGVSQDFSSPVVYAVKAADETSQNWTVTVTVAA